MNATTSREAAVTAVTAYMARRGTTILGQARIIGEAGGTHYAPLAELDRAVAAATADDHLANEAPTYSVDVLVMCNRPIGTCPANTPVWAEILYTEDADGIFTEVLYRLGESSFLGEGIQNGWSAVRETMREQFATERGNRC
jgi:hypothetical protein